MPAVKLSISLDEPVARTLRQRAAEVGKSTSRYLADLIVRDAQCHRDALAAEGYQALSADVARFAVDAWPLTQETWPDWEDEAGRVNAEDQTERNTGGDRLQGRIGALSPKRMREVDAALRYELDL